MGILRNFVIILTATLLTGCYEAFTPDIAIEPVLCLNSIITAGEPIVVSVTHTWLYTDEAGSMNHNVTDAKVTIYANGDIVEDNYLPREGDRIKIIAESTTYGQAEAEVTVPYSIPVSSFGWDGVVTSALEWGDADNSYYYIRLDIKAKMTLHDPADIENYYRLSYTSYPSYDDVDHDPDEPWMNPAVQFHRGSLLYEAEPIFSEHLNQLDAISGNDAYGFTFFTDRQFSGSTYTLNLQFLDCNLTFSSKISPSDLPPTGLTLSLNNITKSFYDWCSYSWNAEYGTISDLGDIGLGNPVWAYSNVSTGAGIVAARSLSSFNIDVTEIIKQYFKQSDD